LQISTAFVLYGVTEILSRIFQGWVANQKYVSALFQLGVSSIASACSVLLIALWTQKEALYVSFFFLGLHILFVYFSGLTWYFHS